MNILFLSNDPTLFDSASGARARMRAYAARFGELHIVTRSSRSQEVHEGSLHVYGIKTLKVLSPLVLASRVATLIKEKGIEVVSAQDPFEHGWAARRAVRGTDARLHVQVHTDFLSPWFRSSLGVSSFIMRALNRIRLTLADRVLPDADGIRVVSRRIKDSLTERYGTQIAEPCVVPIAVSVEPCAPVPLPPAPFTFALLAVGRLEAEKRMEDILDALHRIHRQYPSVGVFIAGAGRKEKKLRSLARHWHIEDRVVFLGTRDDVQGLMRSAHGFIQASVYEGYGRTLIEAALARVPIITTDVGVVGEVFEGYRDVLSVPPADPAALAVQIVGLIEDSQARHALVINAEAAAKAHVTSFAETVEALYADFERVLATPHTQQVAPEVS